MPESEDTRPKAPSGSDRSSLSGLERGLRRQARKKRGIVFSFVGLCFGLLVTLAFHLSGFWQVSIPAWIWCTVVNALCHLVLWLIPHLDWDERLRWDPNYLYLPWAYVVVFFSFTVYFMPEARSLVSYGFLVNVLLLVGVAGFREVLGFAVAMFGSYLGAVYLLVSQGYPLSLPQEVSLAGLYLGVSILAGFVLNRTRRQRRELAGLRRRLTLAIRGSGAGWWDVALDPSVPDALPDQVHLSPELKALIGFEDQDFPNSLEAWHSRVVGPSVAKIQEAAKRHLAGAAELRETRYQIRHKNGEIRSFYGHSKIQRDGHGRAIRWSGMEWDITERDRDREQLLKLSRAVEQSPSLLIITDTEGLIEYVNPKFCQITGYSLEEVIGRNPGFLGSSELPIEEEEKMWTTIRSGGEWHGEFKNRRKNGETYLVISSISSIKNQAGEVTHFLAVQEDVTERRRVEAQLHQADRMESVGQLVSGVAHDFNNLLTAVIGFADLGLASVDPREPVNEHLTQIRKAGESAGELTRQLLAFGRQQILRLEVLNVNRTVTNVEKLLRRTIGEDLELVTLLAADLWWIKVDPTSIEQLLVNLAVNARDAMPDGGRLTIRTANVDVDERQSEHPSVAPGAYVVLSVLDTGHGMDEQTRSRVFEPFFTTKERGRGTGLGLSTVYGVVKQSDGFINVTSSDGGGSRFDVYLPRTREQPPTQANAAVGSLAVESGPELILLVEDDRRVRDLVGRALDGQGYRVLQASDGGQALALWQERRDQIDLLLTDIVMPGMSGIELANVLTLERPGLKVLLMSGYADQTVAGDQLSGLVAPFLAKPFRVQELLQKVREVLEKDRREARTA